MTFEIPGDDLPYVSEAWRENYACYLEEFEGRVEDDFLLKLAIRGGFFLGDLALATYERGLCMSHFGEERVRFLLEEPEIPRHTSHREGYDLDPTALHHLYHLAFWEQHEDRQLSRIESVVEWGGGYGSMARILLKNNPSIDYTIVDLPLMSVIQKRYLEASGFSVIHKSPSEMRGYDEEPDLFIATWSLDESTQVAQELVRSSGFFGAPHVLMAYHPDKGEFPDSAGLPIPYGATIWNALAEESFYVFL